MTEQEKDPRDPRERVVLESSAGLFANAPWWMISVGIHAVLILGATLIAMETLHSFEDGGPTIIMGHPSPKIDATYEHPSDSFSHPDLSQEDLKEPTQDPMIFFPEAKVSDHDESKDDEDYHKMKGQSTEYLSYQPGDAPGIRGRQQGKGAGVYDAIGAGPGAGSSGRYGTRFGGHDNLVARGHGGGTQDAVRAALLWLARHQGPDGGWGAASFQNQCVGAKCGGIGERDYDTGLTGLSVLAFLGAGYSQLSRDEIADAATGRTFRFGEIVKNGLQWLLSHQDPEGCIGEQGMKYMYNHAVACLALSEAYGMTASQPLHEPAQKAVDFLVASQNPGKGWRYKSRSGDNDSSVTGWAIMALKSAELSELAFPKSSAFGGAIAWFNEATEPTGYSRVGYNARGTGKVYVAGKNEQFDHHESMSAVAVMSRIFMEKRREEPALSAVHLLVEDLPEWKTNRVDFYYWYYASLALFQYDGPDGPYWKKWNEPMKNAIVAHQYTRKDGCKDGSWNTDEDRWGSEGGRVYGVALNALCLEVYYRYPNVFGNTAKK